MDPSFFFFIFLLLASSWIALPTVMAGEAAPPPSQPNSRITVMGSVYCDVCYNNSFTPQSYFLPGVEIHVQCKFEANSPRTTEQITFSVNRTTNRYGVYKLEIPSVDGVDCVEGPAIESFCQARLIGNSFAGCNVPALSITSNEITVKSKQENLCVYSLSALSYRPAKKNFTLCGDGNRYSKQGFTESSFNSSKTFIPFFPPYVFPWPMPRLPPFLPFPSFPPLPPLPQLPPFPPFPSFQFPPLPPLPTLPPFPPYPSFQFPPLPPLPQLPSFPPYPSFQYPPLPPLPQLPPLPPFSPYPFPTTPQPPSLPFPFPRTPPYNPPTPPQLSPPAFNMGDPKNWIPNIPSFSPSSPPQFDPRDPRTWIPNTPPTPPFSPPSPP